MLSEINENCDDIIIRTYKTDEEEFVVTTNYKFHPDSKEFKFKGILVPLLGWGITLENAITELYNLHYVVMCIHARMSGHLGYDDVRDCFKDFQPIDFDYSL